MSKCDKLKNLLGSKIIDHDQLKDLCIGGVPDEKLRKECWMLLLNYLPYTTTTWDKFFISKMKEYASIVEDLTRRPSSASEFDHPLNDDNNSAWNEYFKDNDLLKQINMDCQRLYPGFSFFQQPSKNHKLHENDTTLDLIRTRLINYNVHNINDHENSTTENSNCNGQTKADTVYFNWEIIQRILFIYSKVNSTVKYIQGMNELIAPIYYVMCSNNRNNNDAVFAEANTFFCFNNLMSERLEYFICFSTPKARYGVEKMMDTFMQQMKKVDVNLYDFMVEHEIKPEYYAFRWLTLIFTQEFDLPDVIWIWDSFIADKNRFQLVIYFAISMLRMIKNKLMNSQYSEIIKMLQNYPIDQIQLHHILADSLNLRSVYEND